MSPVALGLMMGAGSSGKAAERLGVSRVVAAGLTGLATMLALTVFWESDTGALTLAAWFFGLALAMGWVMAPATDAVVGAVRRPSRVSPRPPTQSHAWSREHLVSPSSVRSSPRCIRTTWTAPLLPYQHRHRQARRTRLAPPTRSQLSSHTMPPRSCSLRQGVPLPRRWGLDSQPQQRSRPRWPSSCSASYRLDSRSNIQKTANPVFPRWSPRTKEPLSLQPN